MDVSATHVMHGFKTAFAAVLAYAITTILALEFGYWAVISTVIVMQVYVADSVEMCLQRFTGTLIGAMLGVLVILLFPKTPLFIGIALFVTIGICSFLTRYKTRYRMAAITVVIVVMTGMQAKDVLLFGLSRVFEICIGILCSFTVSVFIFPKRKVDVLRATQKTGRESGHALIMLVKNEPLAMKNDLEHTVSELDAGLLNIREEGLIRRFDSKKMVQVFSFYSSLLYFTDDILAGMEDR